MSGAKSRNKGARIEREIVALHEEIGIRAEKVPLSGASHYQDAGHDVDVYPVDPDGCAYVFEVKARKSGNGFRMLDRWLENAEGLFLRSDRNKPLVVLPWETWVRLLEEVARGKTAGTTNGAGAGIATRGTRKASWQTLLTEENDHAE